MTDILAGAALAVALFPAAAAVFSYLTGGRP